MVNVYVSQDMQTWMTGMLWTANLQPLIAITDVQTEKVLAVLSVLRELMDTIYMITKNVKNVITNAQLVMVIQKTIA